MRSHPLLQNIGFGTGLGSADSWLIGARTLNKFKANNV